MYYRFYSQSFQGSRVAVVGEIKGNTLSIAAARCSEKDNFIRKKGRMIAEGRLQKGKLHSTYEIPGCTGDKFVEIAKYVAANVAIEKKPIKITSTSV